MVYKKTQKNRKQNKNNAKKTKKYRGGDSKGELNKLKEKLKKSPLRKPHLPTQISFNTNGSDHPDHHATRRNIKK